MIDEYGNPRPDVPTCLDEHGKTPCSGAVEYRPSLTGTGMAIPRCEAHWIARLDEQDRINEKYPVHAPPDFDYLDAGEYWSEDDY